MVYINNGQRLKKLLHKPQRSFIRLKHLIFHRVCSSGVEHYVDIVGVGGSKPPTPTNILEKSPVKRAIPELIMV